MAAFRESVNFRVGLVGKKVTRHKGQAMSTGSRGDQEVEVFEQRPIAAELRFDLSETARGDAE